MLFSEDHTKHIRIPRENFWILTQVVRTVTIVFKKIKIGLQSQHLLPDIKKWTIVLFLEHP